MCSGRCSVCVCSVHQNELLSHAVEIEEEYKDLVKLLLCEESRRYCMLRHCNNCPSKQNLVSFLQTKFGDYDDDDTIEYIQWISTDKTEMIRCSSRVDDFIDNVVTKLYKLIPHPYIAKSQSLYL